MDKKSHLLKISDLSRDDIDFLIAESARLKREREEGYIASSKPLDGKTLGLLFYKSSTRTRVSFEVAIQQLGGNSVYLDSSSTQLGRGETVADTAKVLSRYLDAIAVRAYSHDDLEALAENSSVPIINALTDMYHPCQVLADLFTIHEKRGTLQGAKVAYVGDGNNMAHSWLLGAAIMGIDLTVASPIGYKPDTDIISETMSLAKTSGSKIRVVDSPKEAVSGANVIYTDVWVSMGQDEEEKERLRAFDGYQVNQVMVDAATDDVIVMHCLPAHRGLEISADVLDGPNSVVWDEAENRLHMQKAILLSLMA